MDFTFPAEADDAATLAAEIVTDRCTPERLTEIERGGDRFDADLWSSLAAAGLVGLALPEDREGAGLGLLEQCRVLVELGRGVAPVPAPAHVAATMLLARRAPALLGDGLHTVALAEDLEPCPTRPAVTAAGGRLHGTKVLVRAARHARTMVVTATDEAGPAVFLVEGVRAAIEDQHTSDGDVAGRVTFADTPGQRIGGPEAAALLHHLHAITLAAELLGVTEGALRLTASYAATREQFGRPIGTFQAVRHRLADGHIDVLGQRLTLWQAAWRLDEGLPADEAVAIATLWGADAAHRIAHTAVHVHGGVGIDLDGEAHRYFTAAKRWELTLGGTTRAATEVGRLLAR